MKQTPFAFTQCCVGTRARLVRTSRRNLALTLLEQRVAHQLLVCVEAGDRMRKRGKRTQERHVDSRTRKTASHNKATRAHIWVPV